MRYLYILLLMVCSLRAAYVPSAGIPNPGQYWAGGLHPVDSVRPADPASWPGAETAGYYYVDNTHGSASDSNTYGCPNAPRLTWPTTIAAGSVVVVRGGPYTGAAQNMTLSGTSSNPVWFIGDPTSRTTITRQWAVISGNYAFVENISFGVLEEDHIKVAPTGAGVQISHIAFRNCEVIGQGTNTGAGGGVNVVSNGFTSPTNIVFYACTAHDLGDWQSATENDKHAFAVGTGTTWVWWIDCTAYHNGGDGFGNGHDANHTSHHLFVDNLTAYENRENAVDLKEVHDVVVSGGEFYGYQVVSSAPGEAIVVHYGPNTGEGATNVFLFNNLIHDSAIGISSTESHHDAYWVGNVIYNCTTGIAPDRGGGVFYVWNNTVVNCNDGILSTSSIEAGHMRNNIVVNTTNRSLAFTSSTPRAASTANNELYWNDGRAVSISWGTTYTSVAAWISGTAVGDGSVEGDPLFTDAAGHDYTLSTTNSPAFGAGVAVDIETPYAAVFGWALNYTDRNGTSRPQGGTWDIGALEYDEGYTPPEEDTTPPTLSAIESFPSTTSAVVTWTTDESSTSGLEWGPTTAYGSSATNSSAVTSHNLTATGLSQATLYHYRVHSTDAAGNHAQSSDGTFTTAAAGDPASAARVGGGRIRAGRWR